MGLSAALARTALVTILVCVCLRPGVIARPLSNSISVSASESAEQRQRADFDFVVSKPFLSLRGFQERREEVSYPNIPIIGQGWGRAYHAPPLTNLCLKSEVTIVWHNVTISVRLSFQTLSFQTLNLQTRVNIPHSPSILFVFGLNFEYEPRNFNLVREEVGLSELILIWKKKITLWRKGSF